MTDQTEETAPVGRHNVLCPADIPKLDPRRWRILAILALSQVTVVIDLTIVNVALPEAQQALHLSDSSRQWVVTSYALTFGSLLLLGGRIADYWGRKRAFFVGILGFVVASALGGAATSGLELFGARALQGAFGALLAPAAISMLHVTFPHGPDRTRAFAVFGAVSGGGAAVGSALGGVLTEYASWRWCLFVNVPVAAIIGVFALPILRETRAEGVKRYDVPGAIIATLAVAGIVYGLTGSNAWSSTPTVSSLSGGLALAVVFVMVERRSSHPLLPLRIFLHPSRGGCFVAAFVAGGAIAGALLYLALYLQDTLGYTPLRAGLAMIPTTIIFVIGTRVAERLVYRFGTRKMMIFGALTSSAGIALLYRVGVHSSFSSTILPSQVLLGVGLVSLFIPLSNAALFGVAAHDAGAGGALLNATQQIGSAIGVAVFSSIYSAALSSSQLDHEAGSLDALRTAQVHGYSTVFLVASGVMGLAALTTLFLVRASPGAGRHVRYHAGSF